MLGAHHQVAFKTNKQTIEQALIFLHHYTFPKGVCTQGKALADAKLMQDAMIFLPLYGLSVALYMCLSLHPHYCCHLALALHGF